MTPDRPLALSRQQVCIIGLGLMGTSLALALRGRVQSLSGIDPDRAARRHALKSGAVNLVDADLTPLGTADVVVLATPMDTLPELLRESAERVRPGTLLMDLGGVKAPIVAAAAEIRAPVSVVAGHPMCGRETGGARSAEAGLYRDATFVLCPTRLTTPAAWRQATALVRAAGAQPLAMFADRHDRAVAATSALAHLLAVSLTEVVGARAKGDPDLWALAASGFRDTSRLAACDPGVMGPALWINRREVAGAIREAVDCLSRILGDLQADNGDGLTRSLIRAARYRQVWANRQISIRKPHKPM